MAIEDLKKEQEKLLKRLRSLLTEGDGQELQDKYNDLNDIYTEFADHLIDLCSAILLNAKEIAKEVNSQWPS